jgi:hypothetical protein
MRIHFVRVSGSPNLPFTSFSPFLAAAKNGVSAPPNSSNFTLKEGVVKVVPWMVDGKPVRAGTHGNNGPILGFAFLNGRRRKVVFKQEINRNADGQTLLYNHIKAIVASRIMSQFGVPTVLYYPARLEMPDGTTKDGIVSEYVECKNLYEQPYLLEKISNPDEAVRGSIVGAWLGDSDRILNEGNLWVKPDGKVIFGDFGYAFKRRVTALGLPKTNLKIMRRFATKENVEKVVQEIVCLSDQEIERMVQETGKGILGWNQNLAREISGILIQNRDEIQKKNPFAVFYQDPEKQVHIEIEPKVMHLLRSRVKALASLVESPNETSDEKFSYLTMTVFGEDNKGSAIMFVQGWQISEQEKNEQARLRRAIQKLAEGIPEWNNEIENQLMAWILFGSAQAEAFFQADEKHFYPLLKFMKNLFSAEEILGHCLGIL